MANVSVLVDDEDLVIYTLNGLPSEFNTFRTSMRTRSRLVSFAELHVLLNSEVVAIDKQSKSDDLFVQPAALVVNSGSNSQVRNQNLNPNYTKGRTSNGGKPKFAGNNG